MKLYTADGVRLFDEDLEDANFMNDRLVIMSTKQPGQETPSPLMFQRQSTPTSSSGVDDWASGHSTPTTPESGSVCDGNTSSSNIVQLPKFSAHLDAQLKKFQLKPCDNDTWKRVSHAWLLMVLIVNDEHMPQTFVRAFFRLCAKQQLFSLRNPTRILPTLVAWADS